MSSFASSTCKLLNSKQQDFELNLEKLLNQCESEFESCQYDFAAYMKPKFLELLECKNLIPSSNGNLALRLFSYSGDLELIKKLLQHPNFIINEDDGGDALCLATIMGQTEIVKLLLKDSKFNPSLYMKLYMNDIGNNAFEYACGHGHLDIVELLLNDSRVDPTADENLPLSLAAGNGHAHVLKRLLQDPRIQKFCDVHEALIEAVLEDHEECIQILLNCSWIDPTECKSKALETATERKYYRVIKYFCDAASLSSSACA